MWPVTAVVHDGVKLMMASGLGHAAAEEAALSTNSTQPNIALAVPLDLLNFQYIFRY